MLKRKARLRRVVVDDDFAIGGRRLNRRALFPRSHRQHFRKERDERITQRARVFQPCGILFLCGELFRSRLDVCHPSRRPVFLVLFLFQSFLFLLFQPRFFLRRGFLFRFFLRFHLFRFFLRYDGGFLRLGVFFRFLRRELGFDFLFAFKQLSGVRQRFLFFRFRFGNVAEIGHFVHFLRYSLRFGCPRFRCRGGHVVVICAGQNRFNFRLFPFDVGFFALVCIVFDNFHPRWFLGVSNDAFWRRKRSDSSRL